MDAELNNYLSMFKNPFWEIYALILNVGEVHETTYWGGAV